MDEATHYLTSYPILEKETTFYTRANDINNELKNTIHCSNRSLATKFLEAIKISNWDELDYDN